MSRYVETPKAAPSEKECRGCHRMLPGDAFSRYRYTTRQGKQSYRIDSRCRQCRNEQRKLRRQTPEVRERERALRRDWWDANRGQQNAYAKEYRGTEKGRRIKAKCQRDRKMRIKAGSESLNDAQRADISAIYDSATKLEQKLRACVECDDDLELQVHVDHIIPISRGGRHAPENLQLLSGRENLEKGTSLCPAM